MLHRMEGCVQEGTVLLLHTVTSSERFVPLVVLPMRGVGQASPSDCAMNSTRSTPRLFIFTLSQTFYQPWRRGPGQKSVLTSRHLVSVQNTEYFLHFLSLHLLKFCLQVSNKSDPVKTLFKLVMVSIVSPAEDTLHLSLLQGPSPVCFVCVRLCKHGQGWAR